MFKCEDDNYCATVVKIHATYPLEGMDNCVGVSLLGFQAIVDKDDKVGDIGLFFGAETRLSEEFLGANNLFRHQERNRDIEKKGFFDDNGRVRAIKLRGNLSTGFFIPLESLLYTGVDITKIEVGATFTHIEDKLICQKYIPKRNYSQNSKTSKSVKKFERITTKTFPEHWKTDSYFRNDFKFEPGDEVIISQKIHGTSARFTNQKTVRPLNWREKFLSWIGFKIDNSKYETLSGSRKVIKNCGVNNSYYKNGDVWATHLEEIKDVIPKNWVIYGEIIGWIAEQHPVQKNYTYDCADGKSAFYIYRITIVNDDGYVFELSWVDIEKFCRNNGLKTVPIMYRGPIGSVNINELMDKNYHKEYLQSNLQWEQKPIKLSDEKSVDEGICIRREKGGVYVVKAKSPIFLGHETKMSDAGEISIEDEQDV